MRVLRTVEQVRRKRRRLLGGTFLLLTVLLAAPFTWWIVRPGEPVESALGVALPPGTRLVYSERMDTEPGPAPFVALYLASTLTVDALEARFEAIADRPHRSSRRFVLSDGTVVVVAPPYDVPATQLSPIHAVTEGVPLGTRSWIILSHGTPPTSTTSIAVPPMGES